jgi:transposase
MKPQVLLLSKKDKREIEAFMKKTTDKEEAMRALVVLHKAEGETFRQIGQILHIRPMTAQATVNRYKQSNITGLKTKQSSGRPPLKKTKMKQILKDLIKQDPQTFGYLRTTWSLRAIAKHLDKELDIKTSNVHVWRILKELDLSYKMPKAQVTSPDPDYETKAKKVKGYKKISSALLKKTSP